MRRNARKQSARETTASGKTAVKKRRTERLVATTREKRERGARESQESPESPEKTVAKDAAMAKATVAATETVAAEDSAEVAAAVVAAVAEVPTEMVKARDKRTTAEAVEEREVDTTHGKEEKARKVNTEAAAAAETQDPPAQRPTARPSVTDRRESPRPQEVMERESHTEETVSTVEETASTVEETVSTVVTVVVTVVAEEAEEAAEAAAAEVAVMALPTMPTRHPKEIDKSEEISST